MASSKEELLARLSKYNKPSNKKFLNKTGFWVSPKGKVIDTGSQKHIDVVISSPIRFNISKEYIESEHEKYGERIGQEGDARDNILSKILKAGWIRIRARRNFISVQLWEFSRNIIKNLESFAKEGYTSGFDGEHIQPNETFKVSALNRGRARELDVEQLIQGGLHECQEIQYYEGYLIEETPIPTFKDFINNKTKTK
jgi:hypothetical protein